MVEYSLVKTNEEYKAAACLFAEYADRLGIDLGFQHFEEELKGLEEMYAAPSGGIILGRSGNDFVACVAIRKISGEVAELKRMYVKPACQQQGIGMALLEKAIALAKACGYKKIRLDTLDQMTPAIRLYLKAGFKAIDPYYYNPHSNALFFELAWNGHSLLG